MRWLAAVLCFLAASLAAEAPMQSDRPVGRPGAMSSPPPDVPMAEPDAPSASARPSARTRTVSQRAARAQSLAEQGAVCGDLSIQGEVIGRVPGRLSGCGIEQAVRVTRVAGVRLSTGAILECSTAAALRDWIEETARPVLSRAGGGLAELRVVAHYACRTRNNRPGAPISEHGRGRAIDISAFTLRNGQSFNVLDGWRNRQTGRWLREMHQGACGPFRTVLGPGADRFHQDHFHFDTAQRRGGRYCR